MKNKKKLLIAGASAASLAALGLGTFAFFTDTLELPVINTKVGTVDISATAEMKHTQLKRTNMHKWPNDLFEGTGEMTKEIIEGLFEEAPDNLNPGDNEDPDPKLSSARPGTDHEIILNITNEGSKSVDTRILFELTGKAADGSDLTAKELQHVLIYADLLNCVSGLTTIEGILAFDLHDRIFELYPNYNFDEEDISLIYSLEGNVYNIKADDYSNTDLGKLMLGEYPSLLGSRLVLSGNPSHSNYELERESFDVVTIDYDDYGDMIESSEQEIRDVPYNGTLKFHVGLEDPFNYRGQLDEELLETINKLQDADINIKITVQAMQHRNSSYDMWETVFAEDFEV